MKLKDLNEYIQEQKKSQVDTLIKEASKPKGVDGLAWRAVSMQTFYELERIYGFIFGSQIALLRTILKSHTTSYCDIEKFFYKEIKKRNIDEPVDFNLWFNFFIKHNLISCADRLGAADFDTLLTTGRKYKITEYGQMFLAFITASHYDDKPTGL